MVNERRYRDKLKVVKVIESCVTFDQLKVANNMIWAYNEAYHTYSQLLDYTYFKRCLDIGEEQNNET